MKIKTLLLYAGLVLGFSSSAQALLIGTTEVGGVDELLGQTGSLAANPTGTCGSGGTSGNGSNPTAELCWINNVLASLSEGPTTYTLKTENQEYLFDGTENIGAFELSSPTEYFLLKNSTWWGLFRNTADFDWAVFDTDELSTGSNLGKVDDDDQYFISHVAAIGDTVTVPEPGSIALFLAGLTGLIISRRRKTQA